MEKSKIFALSSIIFFICSALGVHFSQNFEKKKIRKGVYEDIERILEKNLTKENE